MLNSNPRVSRPLCVVVVLVEVVLSKLEVCQCKAERGNARLQIWSILVPRRNRRLLDIPQLFSCLLLSSIVGCMIKPSGSSSSSEAQIGGDCEIDFSRSFTFSLNHPPSTLKSSAQNKSNA